MPCWAPGLCMCVCACGGGRTPVLHGTGPDLSDHGDPQWLEGHQGTSHHSRGAPVWGPSSAGAGATFGFVGPARARSRQAPAHGAMP